MLATPVAFGHARLCQSEVKPRLPWGPLARVRDTDGPVWKRNAGSSEQLGSVCSFETGRASNSAVT